LISNTLYHFNSFCMYYLNILKKLRSVFKALGSLKSNWKEIPLYINTVLLAYIVLSNILYLYLAKPNSANNAEHNSHLWDHLLQPFFFQLIPILVCTWFYRKRLKKERVFQSMIIGYLPTLYVIGTVLIPFLLSNAK
jgi:hypothetical protein